MGAFLFAVAIWLLWRSHVELGRNWTPTPGIRDDHQLVMSGVFGYIRHPMYAAHILWGIAAAADLASRTAKVEGVGTGQATVWVTEDLEMTVGDAASVSYYGTPTVTQDLTAAASVIPLGAK